MSAQEYALIQEQLSSMTKLLNARFENMDEKLEQIHTEAKKTNGRITKLEDHREYVNHVIDTRSMNCPNVKVMQDNSKELTKIKESLAEYNMFLKYPKLILSGFVLVIILTIATFIEKNDTIKNFIEKHKTEQVQETSNISQ